MSIINTVQVWYPGTPGCPLLNVRIRVVKEQFNSMFGFRTVLHGGLLGYETVGTGSLDACAVRY